MNENRTPRDRPAAPTLLALSCMTLAAATAGCSTSTEAERRAPSRDPYDIMGRWTGVRRAAHDGSEAPMTFRATPILDGAGWIEQLEVHSGSGVYRGFSVIVRDPARDLWVRQYVNATRGRFVRLEGEVTAQRSVFRSVSPTRTRESRLVSELLAPDRLRRTQSVSEDGGKTWRVLWTDELLRSLSP